MDKILDLAAGTIRVFDKFDISATASSPVATPYFATIGSEHIISIRDLERVEKLDSFRYDTLGMTGARYLSNYYRISRDGEKWSEWMSLTRNFDGFPVIDPLDPLHIDIKWVRGGSSAIGTIRLLEYSIAGKALREEVVEGTVMLNPGKSTILKAPFIYKVFSLSDVEILSKSDLTSVSIKYRYSQDNERTWSEWEKFNFSNISTLRTNPIRFFQIEYMIENNSTLPISIQDINLIGDFQNVSKDYFKSNLLGIRECCQSGKINLAGANTLGAESCSTDGNNLPKMTSQEKENLFNPYQQNAAMTLLNKLSDDAQQVFGHKVIYFATDVDKKGQDHTLHEYQLYNVSCQGDIKVSVEGNNFPDSQIAMNQFDLSLFEAMEVHITKKQFKEVFGPQRRPAKEDFLYFCDLNRMYTVDHAQQFRNFNNSAVYYKLHLKKYNKRADVIPGNLDIADTLKKLTKNSTIDELFGVENSQDKLAIANKDQTKPLTKDPIRLEYYAGIDKELIENSSTIISKSHYDLSSVDYKSPAVLYRNMDAVLRKSDNIGFSIWFSLNNYVMDEEYSFFNGHDDNFGWKTYLKNDIIEVITNGVTYSVPLHDDAGSDTIGLDEDVWYCYVLNIDQRNSKMSIFIYKRDIDNESEASSLSSTILRSVFKYETDIEPFEYLLEKDGAMLVGSDMKATNIRVFTDVIPEKVHHKILNQYILGDDSKYLVFADNATARVYLNNFPYNE